MYRLSRRRYRNKLFKFRFGRLPQNQLAIWSRIATFIFIGILGLVLLIGMLFAWYAKDLPRPGKVKRTEGLSTIVLDRNGEKLYDVFENENRIPVKIEDVPESLKHATIAIEDKNFYSHQGLSAHGILRALFNIVLFRKIQGGSTLTQQLVKNVLLTQERTIPRKLKEAVLAIQIEHKYSKDEILQMYLSEAPYGGTAVGAEAAANYYFNKSVRELDLIESAILAGLPQTPSRYSPFGSDAKAYIDRTEQVLRRMREDGYINKDEEKNAKGKLEKILFAAPSDSLRAPHFVAYVRELLQNIIGEKEVQKGGFVVTTTLDWNLQKRAQQIVKEEVENNKYLKVSNGAAVILDPKTGEILALVGSKDYTATESGGFMFNVAVQGLRQPGSAIKPITYATALKKGYTASTLLLDVETKFPSGSEDIPDYSPKNYDNKFRGPIQLRYALANSINLIAVKVNALVGVEDTLQTAYDLGLKTLAPTKENIDRLGLSLTLGGGEVTLLDLTSAFGVFASNGLQQEPVAIKKIVDSKGNIIYEQKDAKPKRVLKEEISYIISNILEDNDARTEVFGPRSYLHIPSKTVAVKTGTTDDKRDNWTVGYTPSVVVGVWVGNNDNSPMHPSLASGLSGAAPIWNRLIREALKDKEDETFPKPPNIVEVEIDAYGGGLPVAGRPTRKEIFIKGTEPTTASNIYRRLKISKKDGSKLANEIEIAKLEYDERDFVVFEEHDPISTDGKNRWQEGIDAWLSSQEDPLLYPPKETYEGRDEALVVRIKEPGDLSQIDTNDIYVKVDATSVGTITKIEAYVDDSMKKSVSGGAFRETINISDGSHILKAKAYDDKGNTAEHTVRVGIREAYKIVTLTPTPTNTPTPTL